MNEQQLRQIKREKLLFQYSMALDRGEFETIAAILLQAEDDPELERMILDLNDVYRTDLDDAAQAEDVAIVQQLVNDHFPSELPSDTEVEIPPLTVGDVATRIQTDTAQRGQVERETLTVTNQLRHIDALLPEDLSQRRVTQLLEQLGVSVSKKFQKLFRDTAIFLSMGREQGRARLAATRRQQQNQRRSSKKEGQ